MDTTQRFFARQLLELQLRRSKGFAFEDLFKAVMQRRHHDFTPIEPYGRLGDRKNDGYMPATGTFFQLYAPTNPEEKLADAAAKAKRDFVGLKEFWNDRCPIKQYRFTFNDHYRGSVVPLEASLQEISAAHGITARPFLCKDVESEALQLTLNELQDVLGTIIPEPGLLRDADYQAVRDVVEHVLNTAPAWVPIGKLLTPEFDAKIAFNGLSKEVGRLLGAAALQTNVVDDFFSLRSGTHRQDLRDHLAVIYARERAAASENGSNPDGVFFSVLQAVTPRSARMAASVQNASLVVMAYYFEACDIFEGPMLLPDKHIRLSESILGLGAFVLSLMDRPRTADQIYMKVKEAREDNSLPAYHDFDSVLLAILFLYAIGAVEANESGAIRRCAS